MNGMVELGLVVLSSLMSAAGASPRTIVEGETISSLIDSFAWTLRADNNASSRLHDDPIGEYMTIMDYTDGYVISGMSLYTAPFTDVSHLALVHSSTLFVPGCVAVEIDPDKYHSDCHLGVGLVTIRCSSRLLAEKFDLSHTNLFPVLQSVQPGVPFEFWT